MPPQTPRPPFQIANGPHHSSGQLVPARDHVVQARADDAGGDAPDGDAEDEIPVAAAPRPADPRDHDRRRDRDEQRQPVEVDRERPELDRARARATGSTEAEAPARHSADTPAAARQGNALALQEDLKRELDRAAALEQAHGVVEVDVVARREDDRRLGVVPRALERLVTPLLDSIALGHSGLSSSSAADIPPPFRIRDRCHSPIRPVRRIGRPLFGGIALSRRKRSVSGRDGRSRQPSQFLTVFEPPPGLQKSKPGPPSITSLPVPVVMRSLPEPAWTLLPPLPA